jgi:hypothetical protein
MAVVPLRLCGARRRHRGDEGCAHEQCRSDYEFLRCHRNFSAFDFYEKTRGLSFAQERTKLTAPMILWAAASQFFLLLSLSLMILLLIAPLAIRSVTAVAAFDNINAESSNDSLRSVSRLSRVLSVTDHGRGHDA